MFFLDFFSFLRVFVQLDNPNDSKQLDDSYSPCRSSGCFGLWSQLSYRRAVSGGKDEITDEIDIKDDGHRWNNIKEKEEGEEIILDYKCAQDDFDDEDDHHD